MRRCMKRKSISDSRSAEKISDKRIRIEIQPAQTNGVERIRRFVNIHLHCIVSNLKRVSKFSTLPPWKNFCGRSWQCTDFDLILGLYSVVLFGSILLSHSETINAKVVCFPNLHPVINAVIKQLYNFDAWWTPLKHEKTVKQCALIFKREAPGICLVFPVVNPALPKGCRRTRWSDCISDLSWSHLCVEPAEPSKIA